MTTFSEEEFDRCLEDLAAEQLSSTQAEEFIRFARKTMEHFPLEDFADEPPADMAGLMGSLWAFIGHRQAGQPSIRIFNPVLEEDGWVSDFTNIFVLQRDMPFLVDSVRIELNRRGLNIHTIKSTIFSVARDDAGNLQTAFAGDDSHREAVIFFQVDLSSAPQEHEELADEIRAVLADVETVTDDHQSMLRCAAGITEAMADNPAGLPAEEVDEIVAFLQWLQDGYFTFLGCAQYDLEGRGDDRTLCPRPESRLGIFRNHPGGMDAGSAHKLNRGERRFYDSANALAFTKSTVRSRVHRYAYSDYIIVKRYDSNGVAIGEYRILGLYTSPVYFRSPTTIPLIRFKVRQVLDRCGLVEGSHDDKALRQLIEVHPRDELFHSSVEELYRILVGIWQLSERRLVRLFMRVDPFENFISCIVYMPREVYRTDIRLRVEELLKSELDATECEFTTYFSESILARTQYILRIDSDRYRQVDRDELEKQIIRIARDWGDELHNAAVEHWGEEVGRKRAQLYRDAFPASYRDHFEARAAIHDIELFHDLDDDHKIAMGFYQPPGVEHNVMRFKLFHRRRQLELSELVPMFENLGFRVLGEHPYRIQPAVGDEVWFHDFTLKFGLDVAVDVSAVRGQFESAFAAIWHGEAENDVFNRLVIGARLDWRNVALLRLYARYMKQLGTTPSHEFIAETLTNNLEITRNLIALFRSYFDPRVVEHETADYGRADRLAGKILESLDGVANLNEDQVLRTYLELIAATVRTSFFQLDDNGAPRPYTAIKLMPRQVTAAPEPRPLYEIFVYSPRVEGVHLRAGKVARGGIRWSDRPEDYRTEVLGLVKAQQVKNAVIVPTGAKGGFVAKKADRRGSREALQEEGIACYKQFIGALLDITDNMVQGAVQPPSQVVRRDDDDPYLVVAADKGTATFSDIANGISAEYNFWLGDAFASGGSQGYDHKKMGITARGAWVAVQRHFRELGLNTQEDNLTVVGIGDMAGDVFGNGMLLSRTIQLVAAFNHAHIFIDPNPDPARSFAERKRLFELPRSSWEDYDRDCLSEGGGIFPRSAKSITLTPAMRERFGIEAESLQPNELIRHLLQAPVDLLWNGGIGTYVKASEESHDSVGDRANDAVRVDGGELRCWVFGEGGNLGMTQRGRIEYSLAGGCCNTDFIDNAGGVDCSDHEVNIKILLNRLVAEEDLTNKQRNQLLEAMTEDVAALVLNNMYRQTQALSLAGRRCRSHMAEFWLCINEWEARGRLNRKLESLPDDETLAEREKKGLGLTRPELAVLLSYAKILAKEAIIDSDVPDDPYMARIMADAFPARLVQEYGHELEGHSLRREIVANQLANQVVDLLGPPFVQRYAASTGSTMADVVRAYSVVRGIYDIEAICRQLEALDYRVPSDRQYRHFERLRRQVRRACRWFLRNRRQGIDSATEVAAFKDHIGEFHRLLPAMLDPEQRQAQDEETAVLAAEGLGDEAARLLAFPPNIFLGFGVADVARRLDKPLALITRANIQLGAVLEVDWFARQVVSLDTGTKWRDFAREAFMDDLEWQLRLLTESLVRDIDSPQALEESLARWRDHHAVAVERWLKVVQELRTVSSLDFAIGAYALREFVQLVSATASEQP